MRIALYIIWFLIPGFFFLMALWAWLEKLSDKQRQQNPKDFLKQGLFVLLCSLIAVVIDAFALESIANSLLGDYIPLPLLQILLLPVILYIGAISIGPSKQIRINRAPRLSGRNQPKQKR